VPVIPDRAEFQKSLAALPVASFQAGGIVLAAGSRTGRLMILKKGTVAVVKDGVQIASVSEPGAVFGELSILLDQPHTADVRTVEASQFHLADEHFSLKIRSHSFTSLWSSPGVSTTPIGRSLS
jgi:CRP/FNR family transcriptional regulator, cyclic AMP receptor protein